MKLNVGPQFFLHLVWQLNKAACQANSGDGYDNWFQANVIRKEPKTDLWGTPWFMCIGSNIRRLKLILMELFHRLSKTSSSSTIPTNDHMLLQWGLTTLPCYWGIFFIYLYLDPLFFGWCIFFFFLITVDEIDNISSLKDIYTVQTPNKRTSTASTVNVRFGATPSTSKYDSLSLELPFCANT